MLFTISGWLITDKHKSVPAIVANLTRAMQEMTENVQIIAENIQDMAGKMQSMVGVHHVQEDHVQLCKMTFEQLRSFKQNKG